MNTHERLEYNAVIENIIAITEAVSKLSWEFDEISWLDTNEARHNIVDWANEFEDRIGPTYDWESSEYYYEVLIYDFATKKILEMADVPKERWPKQNTDIDFDKPGRWL